MTKMPATRPPLPTFLILGAQKSATRWLRHNLGTHPEIFTAPQEVKFFNHPKRVTALGPDWYREQFAGWCDEPITGESTPGYMMWRHRPEDVAHRIKEVLPDGRLIALLRNPVDRAQSALVHHIRRDRAHPGTRLIDWVRRGPPDQDWLGLVSGGWYAASLQPYVRLFGDQLLVLLHDDIAADPGRVFDQAVRHVGGSSDFVPASLDDIIRSNQGADRMVSEITPTERCELFEYFSADVEQLELMLGRDLSLWRPT